MMQRTLAIIKPDAVEKHLIGKIVDRIEHENFAILGMKMIHLTQDQAEAFYDIHKHQPFFKELVEFMISGKVVVLALEKEDAILSWRNVMGATNPAVAEEGTIRRLFGASIGENATHGSDAQDTAAREVAFFFPELS